MIKILGIVICYQDHMMIWLWISLYYQQDEVPVDKVKVISKEHISSPKLYYPEYIIIL